MSNTRLTARYTPDPAPENTEELPGYLANSLAKVGGMLNSATRNFAPLNEAPPKPTEGDIASADGDSWDPGDGRGLYMYNGTEWVQIADSGGGAGGGIPIGGIIIWTGSTVPEKWTLCDGVAAPNGMSAPDLQSRFLKGAGTVPVGTVGGSLNTGSTSSGLPAHSHSGPSHSHTQSGTFGSNTTGSHRHGAAVLDDGWANFTAQPGSGSYSIPSPFPKDWIPYDGDHAHTTTISGQTGGGGTGSTGSAGSNSSHTHTVDPIYYAVAYIMRYE